MVRGQGGDMRRTFANFPAWLFVGLLLATPVAYWLLRIGQEKHELERSAVFNLHDDYPNPFNVCHDRFDSSPLLASQPWQHVTIVLCAKWEIDSLIIVTQSGRSSAKVEEWDQFGRSEVMADLNLVDLHKVADKCGEYVSLGVHAPVFMTALVHEVNSPRALIAGNPMCYDDVRKVAWLPGTPISFDNVRLSREPR